MDIRIFTFIMATKNKKSPKGNRAQRRAKSKAKKKAFIKTYASLISRTKMSTVNNLIQLITGNKVEADLSYQSRTRWLLEDMQSYITSLVIGMAPSKFIFAATQSCSAAAQNKKDLEYYQVWISKLVDYLNIDSNNRVNTIRKFINNEFGLQPGIYLINGQSITVEEGINDTYETLDDVVKFAFLNAKLKVNKDTPVFTTIKPVSVPYEKSAPSRSIIVIVFLFLGLILSSGYILIKDPLIKILSELKS